jgi:double-strand break repair protein MRE11
VSRGASELGKSKTSTRGRGRGRGASNLKQTTLDAALGFRHSQRLLLNLKFDNILTDL